MSKLNKIKDDNELESCVKDINNRIYIINHYLQEWEALMLFSSEDNGEKFNEYELAFRYIKKAYLDMVFINLNIIFDKSSAPNIFRVNDYISNKKEYVKKLQLEKEFVDIAYNINKIRNKAVAHIDDIDIRMVYRSYKTSKQDLDNIIFYLDKRLECLILHSDLKIDKNEVIYLDGEGVKAILELLPSKNPYNRTSKGIRLEKRFTNICEISG